MNGQIVKRLKKKVMDNPEEILLIVRNEYGDITKHMNPKGLHRAIKKLYKKGKIKL